MFENRTDKAIFLIQEGYNAQDITRLCGYANASSVYNLAKNNGLKVKKAHDDLHMKMREYKAQGHTMGEVAEKFGVSKGTAQKICKGIAPQEAKPPKDGYNPPNKGTLQDVNNVIRIINERAPGFEYAGNYTGSEGHVDLRCKKCGHIRTANWNTLRHKGAKTCPNCLEIEKEKRDAKRKLETKRLKEEKEKQRECNKRGRETVKLLKRIVKLHRCPVCGVLTTNEIYCSHKCYTKAYEATKDANRRKKIANALVDHDINLERLYERDHGICAICGGKCDWSDHKRNGRYFIAGKNYPSIDHIVPLSKGGEHSWNNVQLVHFSCNSKKGASLVG